MRYQQLKQTLKRIKPYLPLGLQRAAAEAWRALEVPLSALLERRAVVGAYRVVWPAAEVADSRQTKILGPAKDEVLVKTEYTVMSPGTERAQLLGLTSPRVDFPVFPGYSGSGEIVSVGKKVTDFHVGDRVAGRVGHSSPYVVKPCWLFRIPSQISLEEAAFIELGIIVLQGIRKACIKPGESILVLGQGLIGQLANRISRVAGGAPVVAVAASRAKATQATADGGADRFLTIEELKHEGVGEGFDVVIDATGDANVLGLACSQVRDSGRVVLLGSPRSQASLPLGGNHTHPGLTLIGAHISGMPERDQSDGSWTYRNEGNLFVSLLAQRKLGVKDLITHRCHPSLAGEMYESLKKGDPSIVGVLFDWASDCTLSGPNQHENPTMQTKVSSSIRLSKRILSRRVVVEEADLAHPLPAEKLLRVGVVGGGDIGLRNAKSIQASSNARVSVVCDSNPEVLRDLARQFDVPAIPDYEHLLARLDVDAVLLSVPHHLHAPLAIQAAQAGKHILLEKPMGVDLQDATRIVEACRQAGVRLTVNFSFRYLPAIHVIRELIQEGVLGDTCGIHISHLAFKGTSYWAGGYTARSPANWRGSKEKAGGGILIMGICHAIDYLRYCTGLEVKRAFGEYGTFNSPVEVEDGIVASCKYDNGAIGSITASTVWRGTPCQEIRIWGTHGTLVFRNNNELHLWTGRRWRGLAAGEEYHFDKLPVNDYTARWIQRFAQALAQNAPHEITAKDGWINNATIDAIYRSHDLGHAVEVETFPWQEGM